MRYYDIEGTINSNGDSQYFNPVLCSQEDFYKGLNNFKDNLINEVNEKKNLTYYHFGDGDYFFLTRQSVGSASPGRRALSKSYNNIDMKPFIDGVLKNDYICIELSPSNRNNFNSIFPNRNVDVATEWIYGLVCNKWFMQTFKGKIGLIGAGPKMDIVKRLMDKKEYRDYIGIDSFNDYISIPMKFACDNLEATENMVAEQLQKATSDIFLFGIGHVKNGLAWRFKNHHNAVYVDVGAGIDCLAGMIDHERPYAEGWSNYRLKDYDYSNIDYLAYRPSERDILI